MMEILYILNEWCLHAYIYFLQMYAIVYIKLVYSIMSKIYHNKVYLKR